MPARSSGASLYGELPNVDPIWTINDEEGNVAHTPEETRSLILEILQLPSGYDDLHKLSQAMNSAITLNPAGVQRTIKNVTFWHKYQDTMIEEKSKAATQGSLPLIEADVLKYSEKPLEKGMHEITYKLQPLMEEMARIEMRVCLDLDIATFMEGAICCGGGRISMGRVQPGITPVMRY